MSTREKLIKARLGLLALARELDNVRLARKRAGISRSHFCEMKTLLKKLVELAKHRWIVERDSLELKQELGLGHFEGRSWRGFHHHATLCIAA
ncbi:MAG: hypothetical protein KatS3mg005_1774 [Bryobacteraceae bacterium]|nr:MAG: hypothetical protein KatS3mg005_1774 [Bryobacteraceae bacterium]